MRAGLQSDKNEQQQLTRTHIMPEPILPPEGDHNDQHHGNEHADYGQQPPAPLPTFNATGFNIADFRLPQNFEEHAGGERLITSIPVRKPTREAWFQTHPDEQFRLPAPVIELKESGDKLGDIYLVTQNLWSDLSDEPTFMRKLLVPAITRQGDLFLWPIKLPGADGRLDSWNQSAMRIAAIARDRWVRVGANRTLGVYTARAAHDQNTKAVWPNLRLEEIIEIAFRDKIIKSMDHPVIRQLRGEV